MKLIDVKNSDFLDFLIDCCAFGFLNLGSTIIYLSSIIDLLENDRHEQIYVE